MLGINSLTAGKAALFATEVTAEFDVMPYLPMAVGAIFALGIVVVGLFMFRRKPGGTEQTAEPTQPSPDASAAGEAGQPQPTAADVIRGPNPLWRLVVPGLGVLLIGGAIIGVVIPFFDEVFTARDKFTKKLQTDFVNMTRAPMRQSMPPADPMQPVTMPKFEPPALQPNVIPSPAPRKFAR